MRQRKIKAERVYSSDYKRRLQELQDNHAQFLKMLEEGWKIVEAKRRRPRIQRENYKVVMVFGKPMKLTLQEYNDYWVVAFGK